MNSSDCKKLLLLFLIVLSYQMGWAQLPMPRISDFNGYSGYSYQSLLTDIQKDRKGIIWIVEFGGVTKFDGRSFQQIETTNTPHANFIFFRETPDGRPFLTDYNGAIYFIESDSLVPYAYNDSIRKLNPYHNTSDLYFDSENRFHASYRGVGYRIIEQDGSITSPLDKDTNQFPGAWVALPRPGELPLISFEKVVKKFPNNQLTFSLTNEKLEVVDTILLTVDKHRFNPSVVQLANGNYLLSTGWGPLIEFTDTQILKQWKFPYTSVRLFVDSHEGLWIATAKSGLLYYPSGYIDGQVPITLLDQEYSAACAEDFEGGIWIKSNVNGLYYIARPREHFYSKESGHLWGNYVGELGAMNNELYAVVEDGSITVLNPSTKESRKIPSPVEVGRSTLHLGWDTLAGRLWVIERGKIHYNHGKGWRVLDLSPLGDVASADRLRMYNQGKKDAPIACTFRNKIFLVKDTSIYYVSPPFPENIYHVVVKNDSIWSIGDGQLFRLVNDSIENISLRYPPLKNKHIEVIKYFGESIWIVTNTLEVYFLRNNILRRAQYRNYPLVGGGLYVNGNKEMWLFSYTGSFCIQENEHPDSGLWKISSHQPFQKSPTTKVQKIGNTLYWGNASQGIMSANMQMLRETKLQGAKMLISELQINESNIPIADTVYHVDYGKSSIKIEYLGLSYQASEIEYRYRLVNLETDWILTKKTSIQYTTLPSGDYQFEVQTRKPEGFWSPSKTLRFEVAPPYWETWWFIISCIVLALLLVYTIGSIRIRVIRREQQLVIDRLKAEQNALQAQMDPHFVFNILASVQYLVLESSKERVITFLNMFSRSLRNTLDQTQKNSLQLRHEIQFLKEYIEMERFRLEEKFDYSVQNLVDESLLRSSIPPFIIQPFIENAIQHGLKNKAGLGKLTLLLETDRDYFKVTITDNGIGRQAAGRFRQQQAAHNGNSHGIGIIEQRLALYNNRKESVFITDLKSDKGEALGTQVLIFIKRKDHESINY